MPSSLQKLWQGHCLNHLVPCSPHQKWPLPATFKNARSKAHCTRQGNLIHVHCASPDRKPLCAIHCWATADLINVICAVIHVLLGCCISTETDPKSLIFRSIEVTWPLPSPISNVGCIGLILQAAGLFGHHLHRNSLLALADTCWKDHRKERRQQQRFGHWTLAPVAAYSLRGCSKPISCEATIILRVLSDGHLHRVSNFAPPSFSMRRRNYITLWWCHSCQNLFESAVLFQTIHIDMTTAGKQVLKPLLWLNFQDIHLYNPISTQFAGNPYMILCLCKPTWNLQLTSSMVLNSLGQQS